MNARSDTRKGSDLPDAILRSLQALGLDATWQLADPAADDPQDRHLHVRWSGQEHSFPVVIRRTARPSLVALAGPPPEGTILVSEYVSDGVAAELERFGWAGFVDAEGNASLTAPGLVVKVRGHRPRMTPPTSPTTPFTKVGLPVTFGLLVADARGTQWTQRELARLTGTSLGTVNRVIRGLRDRYLDQEGRISHREPLMTRWTAAYLETQPMAWPSEHFTSSAWDSVADLESDSLPPGCLVSSELAAHHRGFPVRPTTALVHCLPEHRNDVIRSGRLRPDPAGNIALRPAFWSADLFPADTETPDFLIRADLLLEGDPRLDDIAGSWEL